VTIVGVISALVEIYILYESFLNPAVGGSPTSYPWVAVFAIAGLILFYVSREYRKRQGINLSHVFAEIPPE
jgi:hypothetical protein